MPRTCSICGHTARAAIDEALVTGEPFRNIAKQYGVGSTALFRHSKSHLPARLTKAAAAAEVANADDLLAKVTALETKAAFLGQKAERGGDLRCALVAVRELTRIVELLARLTGQLGPETQKPTGPSSVALVHIVERCRQCGAETPGQGVTGAITISVRGADGTARPLPVPKPSFSLAGVVSTPPADSSQGGARPASTRVRDPTVPGTVRPGGAS